MGSYINFVTHSRGEGVRLNIRGYGNLGQCYKTHNYYLNVIFYINFH